MTTRTTTVGQGKQGFRRVLVMTAATVALVGGVVLFQFRPAGDAAAPTAATGSTAGDRLNSAGGLDERLLQGRYDQAEAVAQAAPPRGGMAELYAELQAGAGTGSATSAAVDTMGGMAELYRDQRAAADQHLTRGTCGEVVQPVTC